MIFYRGQAESMPRKLILHWQRLRQRLIPRIVSCVIRQLSMEPLWRISAATYKLARTIILSVTGVVPVSLILAMFLSNNLSKPIKEITRIIDNTSELNFNVMNLTDGLVQIDSMCEENDSYISGSTRSVSDLENIVKEFSL